MRRRGFLALVGAATGTIAGCGSMPDTDGETPPQTTSRVTSSTPTPIRESIGSVDLPVPRNEIRTPLPRDHIPAIVDPAFDDDWTNLEVPDSSMYDGGPLLPDDSAVIGVEREGDARAYPLRILDWHEVVNDVFEPGSTTLRTPSVGDFASPLVVSYCPLCGSGVTARRTVKGVETRFGVSGRLWRNNLLLYDERTGSLWSQILGAAIRGPRTGERLSLLPSSLTTWGEWRDANPETVVLLPPPHSNTVRGADATFDYFSSKYSYERENQLIGFDDESDGQLHPKTLVIGVASDGAAKAYPFGVVQEHDVIDDTVGDFPVVVATGPDGTLVAYEGRVDGTTLEFEPAGDAHVRAGGSRWDRTTGRAVDGPHRGSRLEPATDLSPMFWSAWSDFHPDTAVYGTSIGD